RPLFPADPELRRAVEEADAWGEGAVQDIGRRLVWFHFLHSPEAMSAWVAREQDPRMLVVKKTFRRPAARMAATANRATPDRVRTDLAVLPALLDRIDALIARGVIGDPDAPNAADFQLLSSVGVWSIPRDIRPAIVDRPCGEAMLRLFPIYEGDGVAPGVAPAAWLAPLRASIAEREAAPAIHHAG
ncbi:MAG: hypothetical protein JHC95_22580, partial [Solirubrobacteraceae bacterium]|nr:hypothetical protein [Solirubrobacteraceae bacterium]